MIAFDDGRAGAPLQRSTDHEQTERVDAGVAEAVERVRLQGGGFGPPTRAEFTDEQHDIDGQHDRQDTTLLAVRYCRELFGGAPQPQPAVDVWSWWVHPKPCSHYRVK